MTISTASWPISVGMSEYCGRERTTEAKEMKGIRRLWSEQHVVSLGWCYTTSYLYQRLLHTLFDLFFCYGRAHCADGRRALMAFGQIMIYLLYWRVARWRGDEVTGWAGGLDSRQACYFLRK